MITCSVLGGQCTKSHCLNGRSSPSTIRSASPESTRKASVSVSQWYIELGSPGSRTARFTPSIGKYVSASKSVLPVKDTLCLPGRECQRASRAFRTNHPPPKQTEDGLVAVGGGW